MKLYRPHYKSRDGTSKKSRKWWLSLPDHIGVTRYFPGFTDKGATRDLGKQIERLVSLKVLNEPPDAQLTKWLENIPDKLKDKLVSVGLLDKSRAGQLLTEQLHVFIESLSAKEVTAKHIRETESQVGRVLKDCEFAYWSDISPRRLEHYLKRRRDEGLSYRRSNIYLKSFKQFCLWCVDAGFAAESPVRQLKPLNAALDQRHRRRVISIEEMRRLLQETATGPVYKGLSGAERSLLYRCALLSGLRANELRTLKVRCLDFNSLTLTVESGYSKHRREDVLPLHRDLAALLKEHVRGKLGGAKVFSKVPEQTAAMLREDLKPAGIEYETEDGCFDFHSMRHTYITGLRHAPSRVAQQLARHRSSAQTDRYCHVGLHDQRSALDYLPDLNTKKSEKATGTDDLHPNLHQLPAQQCTTVHNDTKARAFLKHKPRLQRARQGSKPQQTDWKADKGQNRVYDSNYRLQCRKRQERLQRFSPHRL